MKCPACLEEDLVFETRDMPYIHKGETAYIPDVSGEFCPACGEMVLSPSEAERIRALMNC